MGRSLPASSAAEAPHVSWSVQRRRIPWYDATMKPGDLVTGRTSSHSFGITIEPLPGAVGVVLDVDPPTHSAKVLYRDHIYTYFVSELCVLCDTWDGSGDLPPAG